MPRRTLKTAVAEWRAIDERLARERGHHFAVTWSTGAAHHGPLYFAVLADAELKRDAMIAENETPIPSDYYERSARVETLEVMINEHVGGAWRPVAGSRRTCVSKVRYAD